MRKFFLFLSLLMGSFLMVTGVSANTVVSGGPYAGCTVDANRIVSCPAGYNGFANCVMPADKDDSLPVCGTYGYGSVAPLQNVVAVYPDSRYCDGVVYITNEGGNLINRCDNGARVYPIYPDYVYYP